MLKNPASKYRAFPAVNLPDRQWPSRTITQAPIWMSTDLRDGNQSLFEPMNGERKMRMFKMLCEIGFKQIEVAFPSASETEFGFVRALIEGGHIPEDVTIEVLTQSREHLIRRTMESLKGARRAIVHVYNATAPVMRRVVLGLDEDGVVELATTHAKMLRDLAGRQRLAMQRHARLRIVRHDPRHQLGRARASRHHDGTARLGLAQHLLPVGKGHAASLLHPAI